MNVKAVQELTNPKCVKELQSFFGIVTYLARSSLHSAKLTAPLDALLKRTKTLSGYLITRFPLKLLAWKIIQLELSNNRFLKYCDEHEPIFLEADGSSVRIAATLL